MIIEVLEVIDCLTKKSWLFIMQCNWLFVNYCGESAVCL